MQAKRQDLMTSLGLLVLRLGIGGFMLTHGWGKLQMMIDGEFEKFADPIGLGSSLSLVLVMLAEFGCAILVILGFATRFAAMPMAFAMGVGAFVFHGGDPWTMGEGARLFLAGDAKSWASKEPPMLYLIPALTLIFTGAGRFSFDGLIWPMWRRRRALRKAAAA